MLGRRNSCWQTRKGIGRAFILSAALSTGSLATQARAQDAGAVPQTVAFVDTVAAEAKAVASITLSPDGSHLYGATIGGVILRWSVDPATGDLSDVQAFEHPYFEDKDGPRGFIGLAFDPSDSSMLWVTDNYPVARSGNQARRPEFSGRISRIRLGDGPEFTGQPEVYIQGLPRSCGDHLSNSLAFHEDPDAADGAQRMKLYLSQGSNSAMGAPDAGWCFRPERLLSAAVIEIDPSRTPPEGGFDVSTEPLPLKDNRRFGYTWVLKKIFWPSDDGKLKNGGIEIDEGPFKGNYLHFAADGVASVREGAEINAPLVQSFYDPFAPDAVAQIYATGIRNGYDLLWHSNGWLYVPSNGATGGGSIPDDPSTPVDESRTKVGRMEDFLLKIDRGAYMGHPNPVRDEFIAYGGNPTDGVDPNEVVKYDVGTMPDPRYDVAKAHAIGHHFSPNGVMEYTADNFGPALKGAVMFVQYSAGNNLRAMTLDEAGAVASDFIILRPDGSEITYPDPLDVTAGLDGRIYIATLNRSNGTSQIVKLDPVAPPTKSGG